MEFYICSIDDEQDYLDKPTTYDQGRGDSMNLAKNFFAPIFFKHVSSFRVHLTYSRKNKKKIQNRPMGRRATFENFFGKISLKTQILKKIYFFPPTGRDHDCFLLHW